MRIERPTEVIFDRPITSKLSPEARAAADKLIAAAELLLSSESNYLCGEWCIADVDFALMLNRLAFNGDEIPERLATYARYQWQRPSVQLWLEQMMVATSLTFQPYNANCPDGSAPSS